MRAALAFLLGASLAGLGAEPPDALQREGEALFMACRFQDAARTFEKALAARSSALLHLWVGRSYARLASIATPLSATRYARKAQFHLETAVELEPADRQYAAELFEFYLESAGWFDGGLDRAAVLLDRFEPAYGDGAMARQRLATAREDASGIAWRMQSSVTRFGAILGRLLPHK